MTVTSDALELELELTLPLLVREADAVVMGAECVCSVVMVVPLAVSVQVVS